MASTYDKKFETTETTKAGGAEVVSEPIELSPRSKDHILVVTTDSSLSGTVDVEMEMSPDGENWCPAVSRTEESTSGGAGDVIGNEESVKLTPDVGEYKNKHARGGLNFDVSGNVVTPDGSGARDLMHQHIETSKSFNYSQWFKTSEAPTTTYKPVLFRHGGYDNFENAKTVDLTATNHTNFKKISGSPIHAIGGVYEETSNGGLLSPNTTFNNYSSGTGTQQTYNFWMYKPSSMSGEITWIGDFNSSSGGYCFFSNTSNDLVFYSNNGTLYKYAGITLPSGFEDTWIMVTFVTNSTMASGTYYLQNSSTFNNTAYSCTITSGSTSGWDVSSSTTITESGFFGARTYNSSIYPGSSGSMSSNTFGLDEYTAWNKALSITEIEELHNDFVPYDYSSHSASSDLYRWIRFGDGASDSESSLQCEIDSSFVLAKSGSASGTYVTDLTASEDVLAAKTTQNLTESRQVANVNYLPTTTGGTPAPGLYYQTTFTNNKGWFPTYDDSTRTGGTAHWWTETDSAISFWHKGNNSQSASQVIMYQYFHDHGAPWGTTDSWEGKFLIYFKSGYLYIERANNDYFRSGSWSVGYKWFSVSSVSSTDWHHYVINIPQNASLMTAISNATVTIDGGATSHGSTGTSTGGYDPDSAALTITHAGVLSTPSSVSMHPGNWTGTSTYTADIDELSTWRKNLTSTEISEIYNSGSYLDVTTSSCSSYLERHIRFGDHPNDGTSLYDAVSDTSFLDSHNSTDLTASLGSSEDIYYAGLGESADLFTTTSNLSISGWFKTTDTGVLFSNTGGAAVTGMKMEVNASDMTFSTLDTATSLTISSDVNDGEWHHIVFTKPTGTNPNLKVYIDGALSASGIPGSALSNDDFRGGNGFTLLGDGQNNANATSPSTGDISKLSANLSNWSLHSEILDENAVKQLYSNGHVRNIKNLPDVTASSINAWWQLDDVTTPEQDLIGSNDLQYQDGASAALTTKVVTATGATLVEDSINGNAMTMSLTKSFNFTTNEWVATADQDTALCLSFNGFEEQAEYFAIWKCSQTIGGGTIDICDGNWHNVILSYRGRNDLAGDNVSEGDTVKFGPGPANTLDFNWALSYDGEPLTSINDGSGVDFVGGNNTIVTDTYSSTTYNVGFSIYNRHMKYDTANTEEEYKPHAQFSAGIHEVTGVDNNNAFQGHVDETSFHSDTWWVDEAGTTINTNTFNQEKPATIFGSTTALNNRQGSSTDYPEGVPYPLLNPEKLTTSGLAADIEGTNQYINPNRYDASTNPDGGLEGWWRWGDTAGDCSITINDVRDHEDSINARDITASNIVTGDRQLMTSSDSIYNADSTGSSGGGTTVTFPQVKIEGIQQGICNLSNINSPLLHYVRVKFTGAGSVDLGDGKGLAKICFTNQRKRRK